MESKPFDHVDLSKSFAQLSLPECLQIQDSGQSVVAKTDVKFLTQFGPLQGESIAERDIADDFEMKDLWMVQSFEIPSAQPICSLPNLKGQFIFGCSDKLLID